MQCINNMNIDMLDTSTGTAEPRHHMLVAQHSNIYFLSTFIIYILDLGCLVSANFWLPSGCCEK